MPSALRAAAALAAVGLSVLVARPACANGILVTGPGGGADARVRLVSHRVEATVRDRVAEVSVEQVFRSAAPDALEGTYLFPLPEGAAVHRFEMTIGGQVVGGEVLEARRARAVYEHIVRSRRDPGLLELVGRGVFRARVFPIEPGKDLAIRLAWQALLPEDAGTVEFRYPLATDRFHGQGVEQVEAVVRVESAVDLKAVYSPTHEVAVEREGERRCTVRHQSSDRRQSRDFVLHLGRSPDEVGFTLLSHREPGEDGTFLAVVAPRTEAAGDPVPKDVVYVLDTSGSMAGEKIEQATRSIAYGVRLLRPDDRFQVVAFSSAVRLFQEGLVPGTPENREAAATWALALRPEGGTNIEGALRAALAMRSDERPFVVVFVTDGRPTVGTTDADALVANVKEANRSAARVFTFGVGLDLDVALLDRIAEATSGRRDYVAPGEDIEVATGRFFRKVDRPVLAKVRLDLGPGVHDVHPAELGDLFAGEQVVVLGRYAKAGERTIRLTGRAGAREVVHEYHGSFRDGPGEGTLPRLWAHRKVAWLLDQIRLHGRSPEVVDEVVAVATRFAIVTPFTAALVVEPGTPVPAIRDAELADHVETDADLPFRESFGVPGISDVPFEGPRHDGLIGVGGGAGGAFPGRGGARDLRTGGGGRPHRDDDAVEHALRWLAAHQAPDGRWEAAAFDRWCDGRPVDVATGPDGLGDASHDPGTTGVALLAFLGAGYTSRGNHPFAKVVSSGLRHLRTSQDAEGRFAPAGSRRGAASHAVCTLAMVEAYGMTGSPILRGPAARAVTALRASRAPSGAWADEGGTPDLAASTWAVMALRSAALVDADARASGRDLAFGLPADVDDATLRWADALPEEATPIATMVRLWSGQRPASLRAAGDLLASRVPGPRTDASWVHFGSLAAFQLGGTAWTAWGPALSSSVVATQRTDGEPCSFRGSWDPVGRTEGGRVWATALMAGAIEVRYRYDRVYGVRGGSSDPGAAAVEREARASEALRDLAEAAVDPGAPRAVRRVDGKSFVHREGRWVDTAWDGKTAPTPVEAYGDAYFALLARGERVGRILAVGHRVVFVLDGEAYEVVPPK